MDPRQCVLRAVRTAKWVGQSLLLALFFVQAAPSDAQSQTVVVRIDARALSANQAVVLSGNQVVATFSTQAVQSFQMTPGSYRLSYGGTNSRAEVIFTVTNA